VLEEEDVEEDDDALGEAQWSATEATEKVVPAPERGAGEASGMPWCEPTATGARALDAAASETAAQGTTEIGAVAATEASVDAGIEAVGSTPVTAAAAAAALAAASAAAAVAAAAAAAEASILSE
jgi:hypothetical protein